MPGFRSVVPCAFTMIFACSSSQPYEASGSPTIAKDSSDTDHGTPAVEEEKPTCSPGVDGGSVDARPHVSESSDPIANVRLVYARAGDSSRPLFQCLASGLRRVLAVRASDEIIPVGFGGVGRIGHNITRRSPAPHWQEFNATFHGDEIGLAFQQEEEIASGGDSAGLLRVVRNIYAAFRSLDPHGWTIVNERGTHLVSHATTTRIEGDADLFIEEADGSYRVDKLPLAACGLELFEDLR